MFCEALPGTDNSEVLGAFQRDCEGFLTRVRECWYVVQVKVMLGVDASQVLIANFALTGVTSWSLPVTTRHYPVTTRLPVTTVTTRHHPLLPVTTRHYRHY